MQRWSLKHQDAADFFGFSVITSQRYATGERDVPQSLEMLIRLMIALKLDPAKVTEWLEEER